MSAGSSCRTSSVAGGSWLFHAKTSGRRKIKAAFLQECRFFFVLLPPNKQNPTQWQ
jgi:hypothetical protein